MTRVVVVGGGVGGLVAALLLARRGLAVTLLDRETRPGGKLRQERVGPGGHAIDAGPTVFTLRPVFERIFAEAGASLADHLTLRPAAILARHAWGDGTRLDLHADPEASADAIGAFAGLAAAAGFRAFLARAAAIHRTLDAPFMQASAASLPNLVRRAPLRDLAGINPFRTLWGALGEYFPDPRLRQLFGRYATYVGASPFAAPATLMLIAHVEQSGVWYLDGGMIRLAEALASLARDCGATLRAEAEVAEIEVAGSQVRGVRLASGERLPADAVVCNADVAALAGGLLGRGAAGAVPAMPAAERSLSAVTWAVRATATGFPLLRHSVFFSDDSRAEFSALAAGRLPPDPTVYVCAQDRGDAVPQHHRGDAVPDHRGVAPEATGPERLLCLVNAPARADAGLPDEPALAAVLKATGRRLACSGLALDVEAAIRTTPHHFARRYPGTGGALYGRASHGWAASFRRPGVRTALPGLYLAGGSAHPGAGLPMAALSGRMAAECLIDDLASTSRSRRTATAGGTSTR